MIQGLKRAVRSEGVGRTILRLAWTAGPVTYLALQVGYYLAYGESVPTTLFFYFAGYTVVAGLTAVLVRIVFRATHGERVARDRVSLERCLALLPGLLLQARDRALDGYDDESARQVAARYLLQNPDATELAVSSAIRDLGGTRDLAYSFQRIEVFRRNGMMTRVLAESQRIQRDVAGMVDRLQAVAPVTAQLVADRAAGSPPSKAAGHRRVEGFIERALAADSTDDTALLTLSDIEEIFGLAIEFLSGRSFPLVLFRFEGDAKTREAWNELERARREYRTRLRSRNSRLRLIAELLSKRLPDYIPGSPRLTGVPQLMKAVSSAMERWARSIRAPRIRPLLDSDVDAFRRAVAVYRQLEGSDAALVRCHARLMSTARAYQELVHLNAGRSGRVSQVVGWIGSQFRVEQREISLTENQRLAFARSVDEVLSSLGTSSDPEHLRTAAVDIIGQLERSVALYRTEYQQAIELSKAPTFSAIEPGLSRRVLVDWVTAIVSDLDESPQEYYVRRVAQLTRYHGMVLDEKSRPALARKLGIDPELLGDDASQAEQSETPWAQPLARVPQLSPRLSAALRGVPAPSEEDKDVE